MKFIDELYELYKEQLVGDEEDAIALVLYTLQDHSKEDLMKLIHDMNDEELYQMLGHYLIEQLKNKMEKEGIGQFKDYPPHRESKNIH